jgi:Domain of Unknown Function (DUF1080)
MKITSFFTLTLTLMLLAPDLLIAQKNSTEVIKENYVVFNREVSYKDGVASLNAQPNDGFLWLNKMNFKNGTIELDIKGRNAQGQSFVGIAFHAHDNQTYDAVYFRPFNFKSHERGSHAVQYIAMPENDWSTLRESFPQKYENAISPIPDPVDWFHAKIVVNYPHVKVYVNGSDRPALEVDQLSKAKQGKVGFWVGNGSDGWFRNLKITEN